MSVFEPKSGHLREVLIICFHLKKSAVEAHRMLLSIYGDVDVKNRHGGGKEKLFEDSDWMHYLLKIRAKRKKNWQNYGE